MFLSHLDLMRAFSRAIRRSGIPIKYSEGFNPHMRMSFGLPLQVGVTGGAEYLDIELESSVGADEAMAMLNGQLPRGLRVGAARVTESSESVMSMITHASYEMRVGYCARTTDAAAATDTDDAAANAHAAADAEATGAALKKAVELFRLPGERVITKQPAQGIGAKPKHGAKSSVNAAKTMDIAPLIREIEACGGILKMTVCAGSVNNVKPDLVLESLNDIWMEMHGGAFARVALHRTALYAERGGALIKPIDI